ADRRARLRNGERRAGQQRGRSRRKFQDPHVCSSIGFQNKAPDQARDKLAIARTFLRSGTLTRSLHPAAKFRARNAQRATRDAHRIHSSSIHPHEALSSLASQSRDAGSSQNAPTISWRSKSRREDADRAVRCERRPAARVTPCRAAGAIFVSAFGVSAIANASLAEWLGASAAIRGEAAAAAMPIDVSKMIFSGRAWAEWIRMIVRSTSGAADAVASGGRLQSSTKSSAMTNAPAKRKYRMMGIGRYR
ncbi:hypothetical protein, partial [Bradyrhizobium sp. SHOUNA76]|uniref:hypothetical protein n=1 Tax=Bradyrhizobium sp. SHOUNA76 TaxID=2908927 RepID=UPI001FF61C04